MSFQTIKTMAPLVMLYFVRDLDAEDPTVFMQAALFFAASMSVVLGSWLYLLRLTSQSTDKSVIKVTEKDLQPANPLGDALADKLDPSRAQQEAKDMTVGEYDKAQVLQKTEASRDANPNRWRGVRTNGIYVRGHTEADDPELKRPFKAKSQFADLMAQYEEAKIDSASDGEEVAKLKEGEEKEKEKKKEKEKEAKKDK